MSAWLRRGMDRTKAPRYRRRAAGCVLLLLVIWVGHSIWRSYHSPVLRTWEIEAGCLGAPVRLLVLSDLHGCLTEADGALLDLAAEAEPDLILLDGDMLNSDSPNAERVAALVRRFSGVAPVYYAWGNHERDYLRAGTSDLQSELETAGATVLEKSFTDIQVRGVSIRLGGLYDYAFAQDDHNTCDPESMAPEVYSFLRAFQDTDAYKIMLSHRPDSFLFGEATATWDIDLVVSGHDHGGQVVLPLLGGVFGGDQGLFPTYIHGVYQKGRLTFAITSGLGSQRERLPRFNNPPELMVLDLVPADGPERGDTCGAT